MEQFYMLGCVFGNNLDRPPFIGLVPLLELGVEREIMWFAKEAMEFENLILTGRLRIFT